MFSLFFRAFAVLESKFLHSAIRRTFLKLVKKIPGVKSGIASYRNAIKWSRKATSGKIATELLTLARFRVGGYAKFSIEKFMTKRLIEKWRGISKYVNQTAIEGRRRFQKLDRSHFGQQYFARKFSKQTSMLLMETARKEIWFKLNRRVADLEGFFRWFDSSYRRMKLINSNNPNNLRNMKENSPSSKDGLFLNSSWLVGYKRGEPNGMLFTKNSSFTVQGLNDNMIDRMLAAPDAGKYLWNTLWLPRRGRKPENVIRSLFSGAFKKEYAKRQQAFKRG